MSVFLSKTLVVSNFSKFLSSSFRFSLLSSTLQTFTTLTMTSSNKENNRGSFIVFEGIDRSGKSTQCKLLSEYFKSNNILHSHIRFPNRSTTSGKIINDYLQSKNNLNDRAIHLLFSANRHECSNDIINKLNNGINIICDRYSYSGIVYTYSKNKLNNNKDKNISLKWCQMTDNGLPKPDCIIYLDLSINEVSLRGGFGNERYEKKEFLTNVLNCYKLLIEEDNNNNNNSVWKVVNAKGDKSDIHKQIINIVNNIIKSSKTQPIEYLKTS